MNLRVLITGGAGFIGTRLARACLQQGWEVAILYRSRIGKSDPIHVLEEIQAFPIHDNGAGAFDILGKFHPDLVFHMASMFTAVHQREDVQSLVDSNIGFATQVLEAMARHSVPYLVNTGTSWQHAAQGDYEPVNLYAATKQAFQDIVEYYVAAASLRAITLQLFDTYGPNDPRAKLLGLLERASLDHSSLEMSPGHQLIDLVYVDDVVRAFLVAAKRLVEGNAQGHEIYAISSGRPVTLRDLVKIYEKVSGRSLNIVWGGRPYRQREVMIPWERGTRLPGWAPQITLEEGVLACIRERQQSSITMAETTPVEVSVVLPCLNEERTVGACVRQAIEFLQCSGIIGEVIVADNGSVDNSRDVAARSGARVIRVEEKGYGSAVRAGIEAALGTYVIMGDADESYDLANLMPFVEKLREGNDLVMGNRFKGGIRAGAMPWHHRYVGNPVLSFIGKLFFGSPANDFHCGLRGFSKEAAQRMGLRTSGMEFASEIVIKASLLDMKVCEVPTPLFPDRREGPPHLRSFRDGWRHLRFLLIYSPTWLFLYPGLLLTLIAGALSLALFFGPVNIGFRYIDFHSFIAAGSLMYIGLNMLSFAAITRIYAYHHGLLPRAPRLLSAQKHVSLEKGLLAGISFLIVGFCLIVRALALSPNFAQIGFDASVRLVYGGSLAASIGAQIIFSSFVMSILGLGVAKTTAAGGD